MSNTSKLFSHTHYGLSTVAAVLYAIGWLVASRVNAEGASGYTLQPVVVSAARVVTAQATLAPVVVTATREVRMATLEPVVVLASRDATAIVQTMSQPSASSSNVLAASGAEQTTKTSASRRGLVARVTNWVAGSLLK